MPRINSLSFANLPTIESLCHSVRRSGFDSLELARPLFQEQLSNEELRQHFLRWIARQGITLHGFDCCVDVQPLQRFEETVSEFAAAVDFANDLKLGSLLTHDALNKDRGNHDASDCLRIQVELFRRVAALASAHQLRLVIEPRPDSLSMDPAWCIEFIDGVAEGFTPGSVGILYDCAHFAIGHNETYVDVIHKLGKRILHVHLCDSDMQTPGLHLPLGDGNLQIDAIVEALRKVHFKGSITLDLQNYPLPEDGGARSVTRLKKIEGRMGLSSP